MNKLGKIALGTIGAGTAGVVGLGLLANVQNGDIKLGTTPARVVASSTCEEIINNGDMDCDDFSSQEDAQQTYDKLYSCYSADVFKLDRDSDGVACETKP